MFSLISQQTFQDDQVIYHEATWSADLYLIIDGTVELVVLW